MENLENKCAMLVASNEELNAKLKWYEEQFRLANRGMKNIAVTRSNRKDPNFI